MENSSPNILPSLLFLLFFLSYTQTTLSLPLFSITSTNQTQVYIVHVQHPDGPAALLPPDDRESWYHSFLPNTTLDSGEPRMVHTYSVAMSGFAARLTPDEATAMESMPGFLFAHPDEPVHLRTTHTPALLGLDQYNSLWQKSSQGEGIIIGVFDGGITPNHPSFADPGLPLPPLKWRGLCNLPAGLSCTNKLIGAQVFAHRGNKTAVDTKGHGTHVAAISAGTPVPDASVLGQARGTASGMAPRAHIASYKICSTMSCTNGNMIKGFDQAIIDGVDLVQTSMGMENYDYHKNGIVIGSFAALNHGILTVNSAGNSGPMKSILDNDVPWILHVGAANIDRRVTAVLRLGNDMEFVGTSAYQPNPSTAVDLPLVYPGAVNKTQETLSCQNGSMAGFNVSGKMVLCGAGYIGNTWKAEYVKAAGGAAIVVMNQPSQEYTLNADPYSIPAIHVSYSDAKKILDYYATDRNPTGTITFKGTEYGIRPSPTVASFSSRGPSLLNGGILKPDVIAPGVSILSAWPFKVGTSWADSNSTNNFIMESGTSQAAPHVSGVVALLKKTHPDWSPAAIKSAIMTTAYTVDRDGSPITDDASSNRDRANVFAIGSGHINPKAADDPGLVYDVTNTNDYIPYLCSLKGYDSAMVTRIVNKFVTCTGKMGADEVNYPSIQVSMGSTGVQKKSVRRTVKNVGDASSSYIVSVVEPSGVKVVVSPDTLKFTNIGEEQSFTVELSLTGKSPLKKDDALEGRLKWVSGKREVSSPIVVTA